MFELEIERPPFVRGLARPRDPKTPRLARRVFLVIIDGLRLDRSRLPFLDELRHHSIDGEATSHYPSWSRPNHVSILTGVSGAQLIDIAPTIAAVLGIPAPVHAFGRTLTFWFLGGALELSFGIGAN